MSVENGKVCCNCRHNIRTGEITNIMTRDEAIENLKGLLESNYVDSFEDTENEALRIAIKALEQEPKTGHWINYYCAVTNERWYACSHCLSEVKSKTDYCPSCGYKMESEDK